MAKSTVKTELEKLVKVELADCGLKKNASTFYFQEGRNFAMVSIYASKWNTYDSFEFTVDLSVSSWLLADYFQGYDAPLLKEWKPDTHRSHWSTRLSNCVPGKTDDWRKADANLMGEAARAVSLDIRNYGLPALKAKVTDESLRDYNLAWFRQLQEENIWPSYCVLPLARLAVLLTSLGPDEDRDRVFDALENHWPQSPITLDVVDLVSKLRHNGLRVKPLFRWG